MAAPPTADAAESDNGIYHIVCHDCPTEFVSHGKSEAERRLTEHQSSTGHNVEFAAMDSVDVENE